MCYIAGNFEAGNSLNLALTAVVGQHYGLKDPTTRTATRT